MMTSKHLIDFPGALLCQCDKENITDHFITSSNHQFLSLSSYACYNLLNCSQSRPAKISPIQFITQLRFLGVILINLRLSFTGYNRPKPLWSLAICHGHPISFFPPTDASGNCCPELLFVVSQASQRLYLLQSGFMFRRFKRVVCWFLPHP